MLRSLSQIAMYYQAYGTLRTEDNYSQSLYLAEEANVQRRGTAHPTCGFAKPPSRRAERNIAASMPGAVHPRRDWEVWNHSGSTAPSLSEKTSDQVCSIIADRTGVTESLCRRLGRHLSEGGQKIFRTAGMKFIDMYGKRLQE